MMVTQPFAGLLAWVKVTLLSVCFDLMLPQEPGHPSSPFEYSVICGRVPAWVSTDSRLTSPLQIGPSPLSLSSFRRQKPTETHPGLLQPSTCQTNLLSAKHDHQPPCSAPQSCSAHFSTWKGLLPISRTPELRHKTRSSPGFSPSATDLVSIYLTCALYAARCEGQGWLLQSGGEDG